MSKLQEFKVVESVCVYRTYWDQDGEDLEFRPRLTKYGHTFYYHKEKKLSTYKTLKGAKDKCERCHLPDRTLSWYDNYCGALVYEVTYTELSIEIIDC